MPISDARKRANQKYIDKLDELKVRVPDGYKDKIKSHALAMGESVNGFINRAIAETIERDTPTPGGYDRGEIPTG